MSVLIPTKQEANNIAKCLKTVQWASEIFVVDSHSTDGTQEIASQCGAKVIPFSWDGKGSKKYNWALESLPFSNEWVLVVDADEEVTPELAVEIEAKLGRPSPYAGYLIRFDFYLFESRIHHGDPLVKLILFKHRQTRYERLDVPEVTDFDIEVHEQPLVSGPVGRLKHRMVHRDWSDLHHYFARHNAYSDWEALLRTRYRERDRMYEVKPRLFGTPVERRRFFKQLFLGLPGKPWVYFFYGYLLRLGFLDGRAGFTYNALKAIYWYELGLKEYEIRLRDHSAPAGAGPARDGNRKHSR